MNPAIKSAQCVVCGSRPPAAGRGTCYLCKIGVGRHRGPCTGCDTPDQLLDGLGRCRWCRERAKRRCPDCDQPETSLTRTDGDWVCHRCALRRHLDRVLPTDTDTSDDDGSGDGGGGRLRPLREVILRADPTATRLWLDRANDLLVDLDQGRIPLDHATLDALPQRKAVDHLRALLIATAILPPDPGRQLRRLEADLPTLLADLDPEHRTLTEQWTRWKVLPRLRQLTDTGREPANPVRNTRRQIEQVVVFLTGLQHTSRHLGQCHQHDLDSWFAGPGAIRWALRPFLTWARRHRHLPAELHLLRTRQGRLDPPVDAEHRWDLARSLVEDTTLDPADRVAGALIVLYAQPLTRIVTLTTADVVLDHNGVSLRLGPDPLQVDEPFATLLRGLPQRRRDSTADHVATRWLFPGGHADHHLNTTGLGNRMRRIGIDPRRMRLAAADQLCREVPPALLAGVLGLRTATVARTTLHTSGQWAHYPTDRQPPPSPEPAFTDFE